jgi:ATP-binding cassette, subfamily B, bacterial HlyB/CyaB
LKVHVTSWLMLGIANEQSTYASGRPVDTGLGCLGLVLAIGGEAFDQDRARREHLAPGQCI